MHGVSDFQFLTTHISTKPLGLLQRIPSAGRDTVTKDHEMYFSNSSANFAYDADAQMNALICNPKSSAGFTRGLKRFFHLVVTVKQLL
jgi:phage FluMu gp28-like protein